MKLDVPIPKGAEERAHGVAMAAFATHRPSPRKRTYWRPAVAIAVVAAAVGVLASPPGRSVIQSIREAVGVKKTQHELFSLPAPGRVLVNSTRGAWVVEQSGSKRLLGPYRDASWSPFGRFVVAVRNSYELVTLEPNGKVHWAFPTPAVRSPRWGGTRTNTRIVYETTPVWSLAVVAGDDTGNRLFAPGEHGPVAWRPGVVAQLAYVSASEVRLQDTDSGRVLWRANRGPNGPVHQVGWSADGTRLLVLSAHGLLLLDARGRTISHESGSYLDAAFVGKSRAVAVLRAGGDVAVGRRVLFHAAGLRQIVSSPDGRWILVTWPVANQWVFLRAAAPHTIRAFSRITRQFGGGNFPAVSGWVAK